MKLDIIKTELNIERDINETLSIEIDKLKTELNIERDINETLSIEIENLQKKLVNLQLTMKEEQALSSAEFFTVNRHEPLGNCDPSNFLTKNELINLQDFIEKIEKLI